MGENEEETDALAQSFAKPIVTMTTLFFAQFYEKESENTSDCLLVLCQPSEFQRFETIEIQFQNGKLICSRRLF